MDHIDVRIELTETSQAICLEAKNTYTKGPMFCVFTTQGEVHKFPVERIFRVVEQYSPDPT